MMHNHLSQTLGDVLETNAQLYPDAVAWTFEGRTLTHRQTLQRGRQLVHALATQGVGRQDRVSILAMNTIEFAEVFAAGWTSGIIVATVNFRLAAAEMWWILQDSSPKVLIFEAQYLDVVASLRGRLPGIQTYVCIGARSDWAVSYEDFVAGGVADKATLRAREEDIALLMYTSGTTGRPKGCMLGQREMRQLCINLAIEQNSALFERVLLVMPLFHVGATAIAAAHLFRGGSIVLHRQFDPAALLDSVERDKVNILHLAPIMVQMVIEQPNVEARNVSSLHTVVYSAAPMPSPVLKRGLKLFGNVFVQLYGQTEVISTVLPRALHRPEGTPREQRWLTSVGLPLINSRIKLLDDNGLECAPGEAGEIVVQTTAMCRGYWNNSAATLDTVRDGWCHTGDIGKFDEDGFLYLVDRKKDMIISGGENIYSREVEEAVVQHPAVSEVAVIGLPDEKWGESVCAVVVLRLGASLLESEVIAHTRTLIASYKKPRHVKFVDSLPKLPSGKVNKVALREIVRS
jgi:acyl-CoA synthetase (AMP-forming)/AMP-acid ligase II